MKRTVARILLILPATCAGLEIGARWIDARIGAPFSASQARTAIEQSAGALSRGAFIPGWPHGRGGSPEEATGMTLQPYTGFEQPQTRAWIEEDLAYYATPQAKETFDLCVLGGSVAYNLATVGLDSLVNALRADPRLAGREVRIHNYARGGYKEPQQLMMLTWLLELGQTPDAVLNLDGANEAALGRSNFDAEVHPAYPYVPRWTNVTLGMSSDPVVVEGLHAVREAQEAALGFARLFLDSGLWRSAFLERAGRLRLAALRARYGRNHSQLLAILRNRPRDPEITGPQVLAGESGLRDAIVACWEASSIGLQGVCDEYRIAYLHVLQPTLYDPESKPLTREEIEGAVADASWKEGIPQAYPALREAGERLRARGVSFLDASRIFQDHPEKLYYDMCHFGPEGDAILARAIAPRLGDAVERGRRRSER